MEQSDDAALARPIVSTSQHHARSVPRYGTNRRRAAPNKIREYSLWNPSNTR